MQVKGYLVRVAYFLGALSVLAVVLGATIKI